MLDSLQQEMGDKKYIIYVFTLDKESYEILFKLRKPNLVIIKHEDFEDSTLRRLKLERSVAEYCWTCTSHSIYFCLSKFRISACTYIDADLFFFSDPSILVDELGVDSVLITLHRFSLVYRWIYSKLAGNYCVQFITFRNNKEGMKVLTWWKSKCVDWCYARYEDGKFGDQLYLNDWTTRFTGVHVLKHEGALGPWSIFMNYNIFSKNNRILVRRMFTENTYPLVFYHFSYLKYYIDQFGTEYVDFGSFLFSHGFIKSFYLPYMSALFSVSSALKSSNTGINFLNCSNFESTNLKVKLRKLFRISIYRLVDILKNAE